MNWNQGLFLLSLIRRLIVWSLNAFIGGLGKDCSNSIANALELLQSCTKPSTSSHLTLNQWAKFRVRIRKSSTESMLKLFDPQINMDLDALYLWHSIHIPSVHGIKYSLHGDAELIIPLDLNEVLQGYMSHVHFNYQKQYYTGLLLTGPLGTKCDWIWNKNNILIGSSMKNVVYKMIAIFSQV